MKIVFDSEKERANLEKHQLSLEAALRFDWDYATEFVDLRNDYGEERTVAFGDIDGRLHCLVYTLRGDGIRVISLRKANNRESRTHAKT